MTWPFNTGWTFMKAKPLTDAVLHRHAEDGTHETDTWVVEKKYDGHRVLLCIDPEGGLHVYARGKSKVTGKHRDLLVKDHKQPGGVLEGSVRLFSAMRKGDAVECEMIWPGKQATDVPTALKSHRGELVFKPFDFAINQGVLTESWDEQYKLLCMRFNQERGDFEAPVKYMGPKWYSHVKGLEREARKSGLEGYIVKRRSTREWWKVKVENLMDVIVLGATDAREGKTGKYLGQIGALIVGVTCAEEDSEYEWTIEGKPIHVKEVAQVSGMTDEQRLAMTEQREELYGRVCEIRFQYAGNKTRLRHPRFIRWRDDEKTVWECDGHELSSQYACR